MVRWMMVLSMILAGAAAHAEPASIDDYLKQPRHRADETVHYGPAPSQVAELLREPAEVTAAAPQPQREQPEAHDHRRRDGHREHERERRASCAQLSGDRRYSRIARLQAVGDWGVPKVRALFEATFFAGLRKAGMPEE